MSSTDGAATRSAPVDPRLLRYARASRGFFIVIGMISLAQVAVIIAFAWLLTRAVVDAIAGTVQPSTIGALAAVIGARAVLLWLREAVAARAAARVETELRIGLADAVATLGPAWLSRRNSARLAVTAGRGLEALDAYFGRYLPQLVQTVLATPILIAVMWWQDWISGLTVLLTLPLIPLFMVLIGLATRTVQRQQWQTLGRLAARFSDTVEGLSTLTVFGRQHRAVASIGTVTDRYRRETMRVLRVSFLSGFALEFLASISVAIVAVSIGFRLLDGSLGLFVGLFVLLLAPEAYLPIRQVGVQFHAAAEGVAATDDVFGVLDAARAAPSSAAAAAAAPSSATADDPPSVQDTPHRPGAARRVVDTRGRGRMLVIQSVAVRHGEHRLPPLTFRAAPGTVTLIAGPSGAGKSSLLAALRGAAAFDGAATLDGRDVRTLDPAAWFAWAGQRPGLIAGTVGDNVALGLGDAPAHVVDRALELAQAGAIRADQLLGVQGAGLSGGQAARVAVARAICRHLSGHGAVIALDEPSAALDADTEALLWRSIRMLADDGATVLLVSHRASAHAIADQVVAVGAEVPS